MKILHSFDEFQINKDSALTVGKFDGLHTGHHLLVEEMVKKKQEGLLAVVVTFDRSPMKTISGVNDKVLMTRSEKYALLEHAGVDFLLELPFNRQLMQMEPDEFVRILVNKLHMKYMVVGSDFTFGYKGRGNAGSLKEYSRIYHFSLDIIEKIKDEGRDISSTFVREEIAAGHIERANALLGYSFYIIGDIVHGNHIGSEQIGRPTINIIPPEEKLLPPNGVYVTEAVLLGRTFHGVTNIGFRPTIHEKEKRLGIETHILDFDRNVYDRQAKIIFQTFLRSEQKFETIGELKMQIEQDIRSTYAYFNKK